MQKFWETICQTSIGVQKPPDFDLQSGKWLGNGHWGWIMRTRRMSDNEEVSWPNFKVNILFRICLTASTDH
eukprot:1906223-Amphidinium_carterae.1